MKIYLFHPETGVYLGEDFADEAILSRGHLVPDDATAIAPPHKEGHVPVFDSRAQRWQLRPQRVSGAGFDGRLEGNEPAEGSR